VTLLPKKLVLATHNAHKVEELRRILGPRLDGI
jgi:XTP/dITP diphosphohydrolase